MECQRVSSPCIELVYSNASYLSRHQPTVARRLSQYISPAYLPGLLRDDHTINDARILGIDLCRRIADCATSHRRLSQLCHAQTRGDGGATALSRVTCPRSWCRQFGDSDIPRAEVWPLGKF